MSEKDEVQAELTTGDVEKQIETEPNQPEVSEAQIEDVAEAEPGEEGTQEEATDGEDLEAAQQAQAEREKAIQAYQQALIERNGELRHINIHFKVSIISPANKIASGSKQTGRLFQEKKIRRPKRGNC